MTELAERTQIHEEHALIRVLQEAFEEATARIAELENLVSHSHFIVDDAGNYAIMGKNVAGRASTFVVEINDAGDEYKLSNVNADILDIIYECASRTPEFMDRHLPNRASGFISGIAIYDKSVPHRSRDNWDICMTEEYDWMILTQGAACYIVDDSDNIVLQLLRYARDRGILEITRREL